MVEIRVSLVVMLFFFGGASPQELDRKYLSLCQPCTWQELVELIGTGSGLVHEFLKHPLEAGVRICTSAADLCKRLMNTTNHSDGAGIPAAESRPSAHNRCPWPHAHVPGAARSHP